MTTVQTASEAQKLIISTMQKMLKDLENRSRCCNLRISGIPETIKGPKLANYLTSTLMPSLDLQQWDARKIERAHLLGPETRSATNSPHPVIAKYAHYQDKELILKMHSSKREISVNGIKILIFQDFSTLIAQKRRYFNPLQVDGSFKFFDSPRQGKNFHQLLNFWRFLHTPNLNTSSRLCFHPAFGAPNDPLVSTEMALVASLCCLIIHFNMFPSCRTTSHTHPKMFSYVYSI